MASSSSSATISETEPVESIRARGWSKQYPYPCHVNAASFVSIKLVNKVNYVPWQEQMKCLIESHDMLGFINGESKKDSTYAEWKRSDMLVKGWIFGSLSQKVMVSVVGLQTANDVWEKLKTTYGSPIISKVNTTPATVSTTTTTTAKTGTMKIDKAKYLPLYRAVMRNDWEEVEEIINKDKDALTAKISNVGDSVLHVAIDKVENIQLFENLLKEINPELLPTMVTITMSSPLQRAATVDNAMAAKMLVEKNPCLLFRLDDKYPPIHRAVTNGHRTTSLYLFHACKQHLPLSQQDGHHNPFDGKFGVTLLASAIDSGFFDVAHELIMDYPNLAKTMRKKMVPLKSIARKWESYYSGTQYNFYQRFVYSYVPTKNNHLCDENIIQDVENHAKTCFYSVMQRIYVKFWNVTLLRVGHIRHLYQEKVKHLEALTLLKRICEEVAKLKKLADIRGHYHEAIGIAVCNDTLEVVEEIIISFPQALSFIVDGYNLTELAICNRSEKVYNFLVCYMSNSTYMHQQGLKKERNNAVHLAGKLAPIQKLNMVSGAALQMQRELQWFEAVGNFVKSKYMDKKNDNKETPIMLFRREHAELRKEGEEWIKKTGDSYTITAALIITIAFAAAITIPGGNDGDTGKAIYATKPSFIVFAVSDAISLFSSTTSLLLFLSILTTRYREEDFLYKLPKRLIMGLAMLFLSVTSMMVAFSATLNLMFGQKKSWVLIPIATLTCLPIASFVTLQLPLLVDLISSTYGHGIFAKRSDLKKKEL